MKDYRADLEYKAKEREWMRVWRKANPEKVRAQAARYRAKYPEKVVARDARAKARKMAQYNALKRQPCMDCKKLFPPFVMDFDHRDASTKVGNLAKMRVINTLAKIKAEAAKCDIVCSNCHRMRTHKRLHPEAEQCDSCQ